MTRLQRVNSVFVALVMIIISGVIIFLPRDGYQIVMAIIWLSFVLAALRAFVYYFTMARNMNGGKIILYRALILTDLAVFTAAASTIPRSSVIAYLSILFGFSGLVDLLRGFESRKKGMPHWDFNFIQGGVNLVLAAVCLRFLASGRMVELLYSVSLLNAAVLRLIAAFRRSAIIYIP